MANNPNVAGTTRRKTRLLASWRVLKEARKPGSPGLGTRFAAIPRMIGSTLSGKYPGMTRARLLLIAASAGYIVSPIDAVPEALLLFLGTVDDIGVALWLTGALLVETDNFLAWERAGRAESARFVDA